MRDVDGVVDHFSGALLAAFFGRWTSPLTHCKFSSAFCWNEHSLLDEQSMRGPAVPRGRSVMAKKAKRITFDPKVFLATVDGGRTVSNYRKGAAVIFSQGDPADAVFFVKKGKIKVTVTSAQGKEAVVAILGAGEFLGEGCLIGQPLRLATAAAMTDTTVMRLEKAAMTRV